MALRVGITLPVGISLQVGLALGRTSAPFPLFLIADLKRDF